jgi:hypothetical protein
MFDCRTHAYDLLEGSVLPDHICQCVGCGKLFRNLYECGLVYKQEIFPNIAQHINQQLECSNVDPVQMFSL